MPAIRALDKLEDILASSENFLQRMHERGNDPHQHKELNRLFSPSEAAEMVGRDRTTLARAEAELGMESLQRNPQNNRRLGYSVAQIQAFRDHFGTLPWRNAETDPAITIACQNFKGGVGKSTTCVNFAHYLALKGYRVLVIDTDSQATTTSMFGYMPDAEITQEHTLLPYLDSSESTLMYAVRKTYWPNIDLIPACLGTLRGGDGNRGASVVAGRCRTPRGVLFGAQVWHRDRVRALRRGVAGFAAGAWAHLDQRVAGGGCLAGANGTADVRLYQHSAVFPHGAQLHRLD